MWWTQAYSLGPYGGCAGESTGRPVQASESRRRGRGRPRCSVNREVSYAPSMRLQYAFNTHSLHIDGPLRRWLPERSPVPAGAAASSPRSRAAARAAAATAAPPAAAPTAPAAAAPAAAARAAVALRRARARRCLGRTRCLRLPGALWADGPRPPAAAAAAATAAAAAAAAWLAVAAWLGVAPWRCPSRAPRGGTDNGRAATALRPSPGPGATARTPRAPRSLRLGPVCGRGAWRAGATPAAAGAPAASHAIRGALHARAASFRLYLATASAPGAAGAAAAEALALPSGTAAGGGGRGRGAALDGGIQLEVVWQLLAVLLGRRRRALLLQHVLRRGRLPLRRAGHRPTATAAGWAAAAAAAPAGAPARGGRADRRPAGAERAPRGGRRRRAGGLHDAASAGDVCPGRQVCK